VIVAVDGATATLGSAWSVTAGISAFARESSIFCQRITYSPFAGKQTTYLQQARSRRPSGALDW
jgi:hypothetical protein